MKGAKLALEKIALVPDLHCDDHNPRAVELCCRVAEAVRPDRLIYLGDALDFGWASQYPQNQAEISGIFRRELSAWYSVCNEILSAARPRRVQYLKGNHEYRLERGFLWSHPAFYRFRGLSWRKILRARQFGLEWIPTGYVELIPRKFIVTHGAIVRKWSGLSAHGELSEIWGCSGASGHTHRMGQYYHHIYAHGTRTWTECGCLTNNPPRYHKGSEPGPKNWQHGFAVMYCDGREFRAPTLIPFWTLDNGHMRARYEEKEFTTEPRRKTRIIKPRLARRSAPHPAKAGRPRCKAVRS